MFTYERPCKVNAAKLEIQRLCLKDLKFTFLPKTLKKLLLDTFAIILIIEKID